MKSFLKSMLPKRKNNEQEDNDFHWHDEGISSLVRLIVLGWTGAILTLNYVSIPGIPQQKIDPTFIASVFTGTLATFGVTPSKSNGNGNGQPPAASSPMKKSKDETDNKV